MKTFPASLATLLLAVPLSTLAFQERDEVHKKLSVDFRAVDSLLRLYKINTDYVAQTGFDSAGRLVAVRVVPKYFFEAQHPTWSEPDSPPILKSDQYRSLMERIGKTKSIGSLVTTGAAGLTTNMRSRFLDEYSQAMVERAMGPTTSDSEQVSVSSFTTWYFRDVNGTVASKESGLGRYVVKVGDDAYMASKATFDSATIGTRATLRPAGS